MPELPEVETTCRGIAPHVVGKTITKVIVRNPRLRWRVSAKLARELPGQTVRTVTRRGKYLLLATASGTLIVHLGMSGSLRVIDGAQAPGKYDHVDIVFSDGECLRLRDPRRFGAMLWVYDNPLHHKLLKHLGPEPLSAAFKGDYLFDKLRGRRRSIHNALLDGRLLAGIGNIYANEALFAAGIRPARRAGKITRIQCGRLAHAIRDTLSRAIQAGGTTLRDFHGSDGQPGYFRLSLNVYGHADGPCPNCQAPIRATRIGQRTAFFCPKCQM